MRAPHRSTSRLACLAALLLTACSPRPAPQAPPPPPPVAAVPPYCAAEICADAANIADKKLDVGPDFVVHRFTLKDGSTAGVYVGGYPQRPPAGTPSTTETIDSLACQRFDLAEPGAPQVAVYCEWSKDFPTTIHAFANAPTDPGKTQAMALIRSLRRCKPGECAWPQ